MKINQENQENEKMEKGRNVGVFMLMTCRILAAVKRLSSPMCLPFSTAAAALDNPHALSWDAGSAPGL